MEEFDSNAIQMELKYCERCGGLWLRLRGSELAYCSSCALILAGVARDPRFLAHHVQNRQGTPDSRLENPFWSEGGNA